MTDEIVRVDSEFLAPVITVKAALEAYQAKKDLISNILKENVDYGVVPGTEKATLLKPGAEKVCSFFGLHPIIVDSEVVEDWTGKDHDGEPFFFYRRTCNLYRGDTLIASMGGSCNSWEKKFRYRWVYENAIPAKLNKDNLQTRDGKASEFAFAIDKAETSGKYGKPAEYWQKFKDAINAGTAVQVMRKAASGKEFQAWEIGATLYRIPNDDIADQVNTIQKMADKRALIASTLVATGLSEYYTQDIEDYVVDVTSAIGVEATDKALAQANIDKKANVVDAHFIPEPPAPPEESVAQSEAPITDMPPSIAVVKNEWIAAAVKKGILKNSQDGPGAKRLIALLGKVYSELTKDNTATSLPAGRKLIEEWESS